MNLTPQEQEEFEFRNRFEQEQSPQKSLAGLAQNAMSDIGGIATGAAQTIKKGALDLPESLTSSLAQTVGDVVTGKNSGQTPIGKEVTDFANNSPELGKQMIAPIAHPIDYSYQHPVSQAINLATVTGGLGMNKAADVADTASQYAGRFGESQMGKLHGTSPLQFKALGHDNFNEAMRTSYNAGDANLLQGSIGREAAIKGRISDLGTQIGNLRQQAGATGPQMTPNEMADAIQQAKGIDYAPGGKHFGEQGSFNANLENIRAMPKGGVENFAQRATDIKSNAAGNKIALPLKSKAEVDMANQMSHVNDAEIAKKLPAELNEDYTQLKEDFGNTKVLNPMELRAEAKERLGTSPQTAFGMGKAILHSAVGGPKLGAQAGFGAETALAGAASGLRSFNTIGGVTTHLMSVLGTNPQSLGKYASPLLKAAQEGGTQGVAAMHFILSTTHPEYNELTQKQD